ncbi:ANTH domain-containing protein [Cephalotus follicularis]|uniref:ANTH domain-containing protein n=1 Tax=Cephalotus follicularis TaxID=3775 RepID=A0A1Q3BW53_CEPFO|nr:ANTH domain-containing protein [Cephalotus follicularis]
MPSKLSKAIGIVKDHTSISLAKVSNTNVTNLEVSILKATSHDEVPVDERYVQEILRFMYCNKVYAAACAQVIGRRIGKTRNWIVALKSLMLVLRIFQDGDPFFPREVLHAMKRGAKILNLSSFRDVSNSSPWDYTAFVRTFSLYLEERLDCFLSGKLQRRFTHRERDLISHRRSKRLYEPVRDMKPAMLLDKLSYWQRLLDRAIATRPTGATKTNQLVQISLYAIVRESFDLYKDISDGLALILDSFFQLQYQSCVKAFQTCVKASKQFEELCSFYDLCKSIGVGRTSEYPSVQKISDELVQTLQEFLKDQSSFPANGRSPSSHLMLPPPPSKDPGTISGRYESYECSSEPTERTSYLGSRCTSLEDLMSLDIATCPSPSIELFSEQLEKQAQQDQDINSGIDTVSNHSLPNDGGSMILDLVCLDDWPEEEQNQEQGKQTSLPDSAPTDCWELALVETATQPQQTQASPIVANGIDPSMMRNFFDQSSMPDHQYNPFLLDTTDLSVIANTSNDLALLPVSNMDSIAPTFQATPTFSTQRSSEMAMQFQNEHDPFGPWPAPIANNLVSNGSVDQQNVLLEQQLWLQNQSKIIAKHFA